MKKILCFLILFFSTSLFSENDFLETLGSDFEKLAVLDGCINLRNGEFFQREVEFTAGVHLPYHLERIHDSLTVKYLSNLGVGWGYNYALKAKKGEEQKLFIQDRGTAYFPYNLKKNGRGGVAPSFLKMGVPLLGRAPVGMETHIGRRVITPLSKKSFALKKDNGASLIYDAFNSSDYRLREEIRPDGTKVHFAFNKDNTLASISLHSKDYQFELGKWSFENSKRGPTITTLDGKKIFCHVEAEHQYRIGQKINGKWPISPTLMSTTGSHRPSLYYRVIDTGSNPKIGRKIKRIDTDQGGFLEITYHRDGKVKSLSKPSGSNNQKAEIYQLHYTKNGANVTDALGETTSYQFNSNYLLETVEKEGYAIYKMGYSDQSLTSQAVLTPSGQPLITREFEYDDYGRATKERIIGDLAGTQTTQTYEKRFSYPNYGKTMLTGISEDNGKQQFFSYLPETHLPTSKITAWEGQFVEREYFEYDAHGFLKAKIVDDGSTNTQNDLTGVTYRLITRYTPVQKDGLACGKPARKEYYFLNLATHQEELLSKKEYIYNASGLVTATDVYDSNSILLYTLTFDYDLNGNRIQATGPLGETTHYTYDIMGNLLSQTDPSGLTTLFTYDAMNRLVKKEKKPLIGTPETVFYTYDAMSNRTSKTDRYGKTTYFVYDPHGNCVKTIDSFGFETNVSYDAMGRVITELSPRGYTKKISYNAYGKPTLTQFPDRSCEHRFYNLDGTLAEYRQRDCRDENGKHQNTPYTRYTYDYAGRILLETHYDNNGTPLTHTQNTYKGKNLISSIDPRGIITYYFYDFAGRKICEEKEGRVQTFAYNSQGLLASQTEPDGTTTTFAYNLKKEKIEEATFAPSGHLIRCKKWGYDPSGNIISEHNGLGTSTYTYDSYGRVLSKTDAQGGTTRYRYTLSKAFVKEKIDPSGRVFLKKYDCKQRLIYKEIKDPFGAVQSDVTFNYDSEGHLTLEKHGRRENGALQGYYEIKREYDALGNIIALTEMPGKTLHRKQLFAYDTSGRLHFHTKADGSYLIHSYDALNRLQSLKSSDDTLYYAYTYDPNNNLVRVDDLVAKTSLHRSYDAFGNLIQETLPNGKTQTYTYTPLNQLASITLPDASQIIYTYDGLNLKTITRDQSTHTYLSYDLLGNPLKEENIYGEVSETTYDTLGRPIAFASKNLTQTLAFDNLGNPNHTKGNDPFGAFDTWFFYDRLNQLIQEENNAYAYDSLHNRLKKNSEVYLYDHFNQLIQSGTIPYTHDLNGNRRVRDIIEHTNYDPLNRPISIMKGDLAIHYTYDFEGRRLSRGAENYLYLFSQEIGTETELAILNPVTQTLVALELNKKLHAVTSDLFGNIRTLSSGAVYRYTAFGEITHSQGNIHSPYLYASKRLDPDTYLYRFAKRDYDPVTGRWTSADPEGFSDGPNLYAYVKNSPLFYHDPLGLEGESRWSPLKWTVNFTGQMLAPNIHEFMISDRSWNDLSVRDFQGAAMDVGMLIIPWGKVLGTTLKTANTVYKTSKYAMGSKVFLQNAPKAKALPKPQSLGSNGFLGKKGWELKNSTFQKKRNLPGIVNGREYSGHAFDQMQNRGIMPSVIENTIKNGVKSPDPIPGRVRVYEKKNDLTVIISKENGRVISAIPRKL